MTNQPEQWAENIGMWTIIGPAVVTPKGERKWLCRCECGTERYVLERTLKSGGSKSCGCQARARAREAAEYKLDGQTFGNLTVVRKAGRGESAGGVQWLCKCSCGNEIEVLATLLVTGRKTHCGCKAAKNYAYRDIRGRRFSRLTAIEPTEKRDRKGGVVWLCRCDCGNEVEYSYNNLVYSDLQSCGCQKREHDKAFPSFPERADGTSISGIKSEKIRSDNTTGVKGVYYIKGKYYAKIVFQKKQYHLGKYDTIEEATQARKEAEQQLFVPVVQHYEAWKKKADEDPEWAEANPIEIKVSKDSDNTIYVDCLPVL